MVPPRSKQLAIGGDLVIPVGERTLGQRLLEITRGAIDMPNAPATEVCMLSVDRLVKRCGASAMLDGLALEVAERLGRRGLQLRLAQLHLARAAC
jgi:hypothetical protein